MIYRKSKSTEWQIEFCIISEMWTDKWILTFPIQVIEFLIAVLIIANILLQIFSCQCQRNLNNLRVGFFKHECWTMYKYSHLKFNFSAYIFKNFSFIYVIT